MISYGFFPTTPHGIAKHRALEGLRNFTSNKRVKRCGVRLFAAPEIRIKNGYSYLYGVETCKNSHICPRCTPPKMANARTELRMKMTHQLDNGGSVVFGVFTLPLRKGHDLAYRYRNLNLVKDRFRRGLIKLEKEIGVTYSSRYLDEAWGEQYGWNPHFNWVFFLPEGVSDEQAKTFMQSLRKLWVKSATAGGLRGVSPLAQSTELITTQERAVQVAGYITHHSYYPINLKLEALKKDGKWSGLLPFEVLEVALRFDDRLKAAWLEFERASKGLHRVHHYSNAPKGSKPAKRRSSVSLSDTYDPDFE